MTNSLKVVDARLGEKTPAGEFWHRYDFDGYGEQADGSGWDIGFPAGSGATRGRLWPLFAGERGEYEIAAGQHADARLAAMAATATSGGLLAEQVWDNSAPAGEPGFTPGTPDAVGDAAGLGARPVRPPGVVARRTPLHQHAFGRGLPLRPLRLRAVARSSIRRAPAVRPPALFRFPRLSPAMRPLTALPICRYKGHTNRKDCAWRATRQARCPPTFSSSARARPDCTPPTTPRSAG